MHGLMPGCSWIWLVSFCIVLSFDWGAFKVGPGEDIGLRDRPLISF